MSHNDDVANSYCPSQAWDAHYASQEGAEECVCGKPNANEDGSWVCPKNPGFCSADCAAQYAADEKARADAEAAEYFEEKRLIQEHNSKCPTCAHSEKYCFCPTNPDNKEN